MPTLTPYRKTSTMRLLERLHPGHSIEQIVADACRQHATPEAAAAALGISREGLRLWREKMGITENGERMEVR